MRNLFKKKIIGITGSKGVLGSYIIKKFNKKYIFKEYEDDITNLKKLRSWYHINKPEYFLHLAAKVSTNNVNKNFLYAKKVNVIGTKNLSLLIKNDKNLKWFFFASTSHVYQKKNFPLTETSKLEPITKYGKTKLLAEKLLTKQNPKKICIGRIFSYTHSSQKDDFVVPSIFKKIKFQKKFLIKNYNAERDFIHIDDISKAIILLLKNKKFGIYNIGSGKSFKILDIILYFSKKFKKKIFLKKEKRKINDKIISNIEKLKKIGWKPRKSFYQILDDYIKYKI